ncbi:hypothetical protein CALCODRAFT_378419 [Calocera cornea HHB12733]|uniref:Uncharacterized protein n=1 Tax=Calocera cornea HHB12733 TaxID=1353952 RepID=A0A165EEK9_9BASI|nr:hypothetical protein CALCODRAFT_378419 [Calocera cornea HHB12733]
MLTGAGGRECGCGCGVKCGGHGRPPNPPGITTAARSLSCCPPLPHAACRTAPPPAPLGCQPSSSLASQERAPRATAAAGSHGTAHRSHDPIPVPRRVLHCSPRSDALDMVTYPTQLTGAQGAAGLGRIPARIALPTASCLFALAGTSHIITSRDLFQSIIA